MAHEIENLNGKDSFAFTGERGLVWHGLGKMSAMLLPLMRC